LIALALLAGCSRDRRPASAWQAHDLGSDASFEDVCFADSLNGWISGGSYSIAGGIVGRTRDGGRTWQFASDIAGVGIADRWFLLNSISFADTLTGLVAGDGGRILKTSDGGETWRSVHNGHGSSGIITDLDMLDRMNGWAVGPGGVVRTRDGGETWEPLTQADGEAEPTWARAIAILDEHRAIKVGQHGDIEATFDGGMRWEVVPTPLASSEKPYLFDVCFPDGRHGWIVGEDGTILHSSDGGASWTQQFTGLPDAKERPRPPGSVPGPPGMEEVEGPLQGLFLSRVFFLDERRGWTVGYWTDQGRSVVLRTVDGGATWAIEAEAMGEELRALVVHPDGRGWAVGDRSREGLQTLLVRAPSAP
jgi:photosystem II stability/assembly factor-like uncharacterized protein